jgi:hypothetical protein
LTSSRTIAKLSVPPTLAARTCYYFFPEEALLLPEEALVLPEEAPEDPVPAEDCPEDEPLPDEGV